jgi:MEDS: MEthanogen/methylotroph, DcmR Sensory domain
LQIQAPWHGFLTDPLPGDHSVQLYRDEPKLVETVALFAEAGLAQGDAVVLVATPPHVEAVARRLECDGFDIEHVRHWGRLTVIDASTLLSRFTVEGQLDPEAFGAIVGELLEGAGAGGRHRVRVYGEMVDLLWKHDLDAAIRLEELWNSLIRSHPISLLCSYHLDDRHTLRLFPEPLRRAHSRQIPIEACA